MKAVPIQSSDDPRSLKKVNKVYVSNKLPALFYMLLKRKRANTTLQTGDQCINPRVHGRSVFSPSLAKVVNQ